MGRKKVGKVVLGAKIIHVVKVRPMGSSRWHRPSSYDLYTWHGAMEAVRQWIKHNDLEKIVRRFEISTTVKFCSAREKICNYDNNKLLFFYWSPIGAPIESDTDSDSASSGSERAYCTCRPGCCQTL